MFTDEQLKMLLSMPDLGEEEDEIARQQATAAALRSNALGTGGYRRMDAGSQIARGLSGIAGGYVDYKAAQAGKALGDKRRKALMGLFGGGGGGYDPSTMLTERDFR